VNFDLLHGTVREFFLQYSGLSKITHRIEQIVLSAVFDDAHTKSELSPWHYSQRPDWGVYVQTGG
jgi:hypothetical protein